MNEPIPQAAKPRFFDLCMMCQFDSSMLHVIADLAGVAHSIVDAMFVGTPVERSEAEKVLLILSHHMGRTLTLDTVRVPVLDILHAPKSEVAHLKAEIEQEYESSQQGLYGLAEGTARHVFITKRTERVARLVDQLRTLVGEETSMQMLIAWEDKAADQREAP